MALGEELDGETIIESRTKGDTCGSPNADEVVALTERWRERYSSGSQGVADGAVRR